MKHLKKTIKNIVHIFSFIYEIDRSAFVTLTASVVLSGLVVLPSLYLPKRIVDQFANEGTFEAVVFYAVIFAALSLILGLFEQMTASKLEKQTKTLEYEGVIRLFQKIAELDYICCRGRRQWIALPRRPSA